MEDQDPDEPPGWGEACRREGVIADLIRRHPKRLTIGAVDAAAWELGLSRATVYRLIGQYRSTRTVTGLIAQARGRKKGSRFLEAEREALIREAIERDYLRPTRPPFGWLVEQIRLSCIQRGLPPPNWRTINARVQEIDIRARAIRRGHTDLIRATDAVPGEYIATRPLEVVQIDHTQVDVIVVDEQSRAAIGRPWITLAIDILTRMVTGFFVSLHPPSRLSIGLCLLHAVFDKAAWLQERDIEAPWPVAGLPEKLRVDNGPDFRSRAFTRACRDEGIRVHWRVANEPHYGGHIERLIGTQMGAVHLLPGTTFSNPHERGNYQSEKSARMTLRELERWIGWEIAGHYHQRIHASLHRPPIAVWGEHEERIALRLPVDRMKFWISFLPEDERTLWRDGIHFCNIRYWSDTLSGDLGRTKGKLLVKYDPRDLSRIFGCWPSAFGCLFWPVLLQ